MKLKGLGVIGVCSLVLLSSCGNGQEQQAEVVIPEYPVMALTPQDAVLETQFPVNIQGQEDIDIKPRVDGFIKDIKVDEGSVVKAGQTLFIIDSPLSEQNVRTAKAAVLSADAQIQTAQLNVDRVKPLVEKGIISKVQYDMYENALTAANAVKEQAKATLANAEANLKWTHVASPVDGIVGAMPYRLGSLVNSGSTLTTIANTTTVYAYFSMPEVQLMQLLNGLEGETQAEKISNLPEVELILKDKTRYTEKGRIKTISGQVQRGTGSVMFRADFPNSNGVLRSGFSGSIVIPQTVPAAMVIPQAATFQRQDKVLTYKYQGDSIISVLIDVVPLPDGKNYIVTKGLSEGDKVVASGVATLSDGQKIVGKID